MASTDEDIMGLLQDAIEEADSKDLRVLLEEAIGGPGPHQAVTNSAQADPGVHVVLTTNDGATFLPQRCFITEHSGLFRDLLADADKVVKDPVPLQNVAACELKRMLWLLQQHFNTTQLERCIAAFDSDSVFALQQAANFMDVQCITVACGGALAGLVRKSADDEEKAQLLELVTPPHLPQELCELWMERFATTTDELLGLLTKHPNHLLVPLTQWDAAWAEKGRFSSHRFTLSNEAELSLLKARSDFAKANESASPMAIRLDQWTVDSDLSHLSDLTQLRSLDLSGCSCIGVWGLPLIKPLVHLTSLSLEGCRQITDDGLAPITELTQLKSLNLRACAQIKGAGLVHVKMLLRLRALDMSHCDKITDTHLAHIRELKDLTSLDMAGCMRITGAGLAHIKELVELASLNLEGCNGITDAGLEHAKELKGLTSLKLSECCQITDVGIAHMKDMMQLTSVDLTKCNRITDAGIAHMKNLLQLTLLRLRGCRQITDAALAHLKEMAQLQVLDLSYCDLLTDAGLIHIRKMTQMRELSLIWCANVSDASLVNMNDMLHLRSANLDSSKVTRYGERFVGILTGNVDAEKTTEQDARWKLPDGTTMLHAAAQRNMLKVVAALLEKGAQVNAVNSKGKTPLHVATQANAVDAVKLLLELGADSGIEDPEGRTAT